MTPARTILITGCSSGIGLDAARTLQARGWRVFATCRSAADCERLRGEGLESFPLDLADEDSIAAAVATALERSDGRIDALFNNGAFAIPGAVEDLSRAALREIWEVNVLGQVDVTNRLLPAMRARASGRIVMNSSVLGIVAIPWRGAYTATKFALEAIADTLRQELRGTGIEVSLIEPGPIATRFRQNAVRRFEQHIDWRASALAAEYERTLLPRLYNSAGKKDRFELPPAAVTARLIHAIESRRPAARYRVTVPARAAAVMRRLLPTRLLDRVMGGR